MIYAGLWSTSNSLKAFAVWYLPDEGILDKDRIKSERFNQVLSRKYRTSVIYWWWSLVIFIEWKKNKTNINSTFNCSRRSSGTKILMSLNLFSTSTTLNISSSSWKWKYLLKKFNSISLRKSAKMHPISNINSISNPSSSNTSPNSFKDKWQNIGNIKPPIKSKNKKRFTKNMIKLLNLSKTSKIE